MEWVNTFVKAINYMEENMLEDITLKEISDNVNISTVYFQKAFQIFTGMTVSEYIKGRRLYLAACELRSSDVKVIDCAYKYFYETPEAFTKAFKRFHGCNPSQVRETSVNIRLFLPLKVHIEIQGGYDMDFKIEEMKNLKVIGFFRDIPFDKGYELCPRFWDEIREKYISKLDDGSEISKAIKENGIGEFGVCIDENKDGTFRYMVAGIYKGGEVPEGMIVKEFEDMLWAKFTCIGPLPGALQSLNTKVWNEWVPNCTKYDLLGNANLEWYSKGDIHANDYEAGIWLPIVEK